MSFVPSGSIEELIGRMQELLAGMEARGDEQRFFHSTYLRTTQAVKEELDRGGFFDREWVEMWDLRFADLYLEPLERFRAGESVPGPWAVAWEATRGPHLPPLRHVLLGMNAHINYDLPQALIATISDEEFTGEAVLARREADHEHIDDLLVNRVAAEDREIAAASLPRDRTVLDRLLTPLNRTGTRRFIKEARRKVWHNARCLSEARRHGPDALAGRLRELEQLAAERVADLTRPGQVIARLTIRGFGVQLNRVPEGPRAPR